MESKIKFACALSPREDPFSAVERAEGEDSEHESKRRRDGRNLTVEERLKKLDETLEKLKQMLQYQLDFLENLDTEAGRQLEHLEQDISTVKIGFTEELGKLH